MRSRPSSALRYARFDSGAHRAAVTRLLHEAYASSIDDTGKWLAAIGDASLRVATRAGDVVACLVLLPMGQVFGGRDVSMCGVAGVAVAPEARGEGVAIATMRAALREMAATGHALSTLYPSTQSLYRLAGYELAGARYRVTIDSASARVREAAGADLRVRRYEPGDREAVERLHRARAARSSGELARNGYMWARVITPRGEPAAGYVVEPVAGGVPEGYVFLSRKPRDDGSHDLRATDLVASTRAASTRLMAFVSAHRSTARDVVLHLPPEDPALAALAEAPSDTGVDHLWMTRVLDVPAALAARGWAKALRGALHLDVADPSAGGLASSKGKWVLSVEDGRARIREGGRGAVRTTAAALAPLFTGWETARALAARGALDAKPADLELASALFAGPRPTLVDYF